MGGFVLLHTAPGEDRSLAQAAALAAFARMGMPTPRLVRGANFVLALYPKRQASEPSLQQFPNGDFVCACGTLIYEGKVDKPAATAFYRDCRGRSPPRDQALGHYAVILHKDGKTEILPDGFGGFLVFYDEARRIASSSFLAVASVLDRVTLGTQGACKYVFNGVVSGNATVFDEVLLAPVSATIAVGEDCLEIRQRYTCDTHPPHIGSAPTEFSGESLVRLGFLDEAGRSRNEPIIVVGGIVVHGDRTYRQLEQDVGEIISETIPEHDRDGFLFHTVDLFQGAGYFKDKTLWPREKRYPILRALAGIPKRRWIPVVFGHMNKEKERPESNQQLIANVKSHQAAHLNDIVQHMVAFARAEIAIERQMHSFPRNEICMLIAEDTDRVKRSLKSAHAFLRNPKAIATSPFAGISYLPLTRIVDTPNFAAKAESVPLQIADLCAYLILRRLLRRSDSQEFFELIAPQLTWKAHDFGDPMGAEQFGTGPLV
jgi:hypothetical protein